MLLTIAACGCSSKKKKTAAKPPPAKITAPAVAAAAQPIPKSMQEVLTRWNSHRAAVGLPPVGPDARLDDAAWLHCRYLVKNGIRGADAIYSGQRPDAPPNPDLHEERLGNKWYSAEGNKWASSSMVRVADSPLESDGLIDRAVTSGFTAMNFLNPQLDAVGVAEYCDGGICAEAIVLDEGVSRQQLTMLYQDGEWVSRVPKVGRSEFVRARLKKPLFFPPDDKSIELASYGGSGVPNPLSSCPGYSAPSGVVMFVELGMPASGPDVNAGAVSLTDNGAELETCLIDGTNYRNPNSYLERAGRWDLFYYGAVMIVPRHPLQPGHTYIVSVVAEERPYSWTFTVAPTAK